MSDEEIVNNKRYFMKQTCKRGGRQSQQRQNTFRETKTIENLQKQTHWKLLRQKAVDIKHTFYILGERKAKKDRHTNRQYQAGEPETDFEMVDM